VFGVQGPDKRHFLDKDCDSSYQIDTIGFWVLDSNGNRLKDNLSQVDNMELNNDGPSWMKIDNLNPGTYTIKGFNYNDTTVKQTGSMTFAVLTFGSQRKNMMQDQDH
jgi:hypothetical protein